MSEPRPSNPITHALIVAAGRGQRAGQGLPKQYRRRPGSRDTVLAHSISALAAHPAISTILVVIHPDDV